MEAILALEDGSVYRGRAFGATGERAGEAVFNTSMTGYQEILTDPSYLGQIVVMTCPEIGNTGANPGDLESGGPRVEGFVVRECSNLPSNWRATQALHLYLREHGIPAVSEVDTRSITRRIRIRGALKAVLSSVDRDPESLVRKAIRSPGLEAQDLVSRATCRAPFAWSEARDPRWATVLAGHRRSPRLRCVAYDFGAKRNIFRLLQETGFDVTVIPAGLPAGDVLAMRADAVFLSNGPGDPATATYAVESVRGIVGKVPMFGICLGHQIIALALGAKTFKLKFGHRGSNHPVKDLRTGRVTVTSQNHGYAAEPASLPPSVEVTHVNLNDGTCEGFVHADARILAVQYHPEASPGPHDVLHLFGEFYNMACDASRPGTVAIEERP